MSLYNGWTVVTMPDTPAPAAIEFARNDLVAANTNPFSGQQQVQDWQASYMEASVLMPPMPKAQAQTWIAFLVALHGMANVFTFPTALVASYPESLTTNGTTNRYWRLKSNQAKWSLKRASMYGITFEIREAT